MAYRSKKLVCLAKSRKTGGFCIAGKQINSNNTIGGWLRPVSARDTEEIYGHECHYENGKQPNLLDIVEIPSKQKKPNCFQCENFLIDNEYYWVKEGTYPKGNLYSIIDTPDTLWGMGDSSYYGIRDRIDDCKIDDIEGSLYLITPTEFEIDVDTEGAEFGNPRIKVRADFMYNGVKYIFPLTDPSIERCYRQKGIGNYPFEDAENRIFLCVSIGLPWKGYCYKFVASVIEL